MKRMKEAWDDMYGESSMTAQTLRDNAARFRKDRSLLNLIEVRNGNDVEPDSIQIEDVEAARGEENEDENENIEVENTGEEDDETKIMRLRFEEILHTLTPTTKENIEKRERLMKLKKGVSKVELDRADKILEKHLDNTDDICKVVDAVYAMGRTIEERKGLERKDKRKERKNKRDGPNRRIRKLEKQIKELRQVLAWTSNKIQRRKTIRKATKKEKEIVQKLREWAGQQSNKNEDLLSVKERALDELRYRNVKLKRIKNRDARVRNNRMFQEDQGAFYRKTQGTEQLRGEVPDMEKFEEFWGGIWEDETKAPNRKWMNTVAKKIREKVKNVQEFTITEKNFYDIVKKRKNWSAPGIDGIQNFWWKKLKGAWKSIIRCFTRWREQPEVIPDWLTQGRTVLLPKTEDLSNERNYRPITCLNTCYKIFTGMIGKYMKEHAERNNIWDRSQLGTC